MFGITIVTTWDPLGSGSRILVDGCKDFATGSMRMYLVHGWDRIKISMCIPYWLYVPINILNVTQL